MRHWTQYKGVALILVVASVFVLIGMIIGSNLSIPDKLKAEPQHPMQSTNPSIYNSSNGHSPFVAIAEAVTPAVVNISAESVSEDKYHTFMDDDFFRKFFGIPPDGRTPGQPRMRRSESLGSGFVISADGFILTNNHVVEGADKVTVTLSSGKHYKADVVGADKETDVAVIKINADHDLTAIELGDSDSIMVGDWAMAVGNPFPNLGLDRTVTVGVVSAKGRQGLSFGGGENPSYQNYIQTDASINPGNSGGPLVNIGGQAIGINAAIATPTGGNVGIGFAIPINMARDVAQQLMKTGKVTRGYLGIYPQSITPELKDANGLPSTDGVLVAQVDKDTPADRASLKVGDVVTRFNGTLVTDAQQFRFLVAKAGPGSDVSLEVWRNGSSKAVNLKLGDRTQFVSNQEQKSAEEKPDNKWLGLSVETLSENNAGQYGVEFTPGAIIVNVEPGSPSDDAGLAAGDIVMKIGGKEIKSAEDFSKLASSLKNSSKPISFYVKRGQASIFVAVTPAQ
jgi:serine protease Do